ncbi:MAG: ABC transporter ATP-binding protein [Thermodesulfovibrionales bacterium]
MMGNQDSYIVKAEGLVKEYHIYDSPTDRFKELFLNTQRHRVFKAVGPVDFYVRRGEALGIVGDNGAGKSTLLKMVAGVIKPSAGNLSINGRVSSILELGTGFHPEFTGRENILLNASLHGLNTDEIHKRMDDIISFADIGEFFDMPVKYYSSGMYMRLAFSLAVHVDADILVIDEALAVGDGAYMKKCIDKIWEIKRQGTAILFCSHSLYTVASFCERTMWIHNGMIEAIGDTKDVISRYEEHIREKEKAEKVTGTIINTDEKKIAVIKGIRLFVNGDEVKDSLQYLSDINVHVDFEIYEDKDVYVGFAVDRNDGVCCYADSMQRQGVKPFRGPGRYSTIVSFKDFPLFGSAYKFVIFLLDETGICIFDRMESQMFKVETKRKEWGICYLPHEWRI